MLNKMARPTEEVKKCFIGVRLTESEYGSLGENKSESIRNLISNVKQNRGFVKQNADSFVKQNENNVKQNPQTVDNTENSFVKQNDLGLSDADIESLKDIQVMCTFFDMELSDFIKSLQEMMNEGDISVERGQIILGNPYMTEVLKDDEVAGILHNLESLCEDKGFSLFEAYKNAIIIGAKIAYKDVQGA